MEKKQSSTRKVYLANDDVEFHLRRRFLRQLRSIEDRFLFLHRCHSDQEIQPVQDFRQAQEDQQSREDPWGRVCLKFRNLLIALCISYVAV